MFQRLVLHEFCLRGPRSILPEPGKCGCSIFEDTRSIIEHHNGVYLYKIKVSSPELNQSRENTTAHVLTSVIITTKNQTNLEC